MNFYDSEDEEEDPDPYSEQKTPQTPITIVTHLSTFLKERSLRLRWSVFYFPYTI